MDIKGHDIYGLDVYLILHVSRQLNENESKEIESLAEAWCQIVSSGAIEGPIHSFTVPEFDIENNCVLFQVDLGSMEPQEGIGLLEKICIGCNKYLFREELITSIEITSKLGIGFL